jgi:IS5 family transposase
MNNDNISLVSTDREARFGCKGKNKFWFGFKEHLTVDMQSGMINEVALSPANITDAQGMDYVCPTGGTIYADKGYCSEPAKTIAQAHNCNLMAIKRNNMKDKNYVLDRSIAKIRSPFERVFSKIPKRVRYRGIIKNTFTAIMQAICFNLKRLLILGVCPLQFCQRNS